MTNLNDTLLTVINKEHMGTEGQTSRSSSAATEHSAPSGRRFSFRNLLPDFSTKSVMAAERKRVAAVKAKSHHDEQS
jgi:hypothetical protein